MTLAAVEMAAYWYEQYREAIDALRIDNDGKRKQSLSNYLKPLNTQTAMIYNLLKSSYQSYLNIMYRFGVTPTERSKIVISRPEEGDPMEGFLS